LVTLDFLTAEQTGDLVIFAPMRSGEAREIRDQTLAASLISRQSEMQREKVRG